MDDCWEQRKLFVERVNKFSNLIDGQAEHDVHTFLSNNRSLNEYQNYVKKYYEICLEIPTDLSVETLGVLKIDFTDFVNILHQRANKIKDVIIAHMFSTFLSNGKK